MIGQSATWEKTIDQQLGRLVPRNLDRDRPGDDRTATARHRNRPRRRPAGGQQLFLGGPASVPQRSRLPRVQPVTGRFELPRRRVRKRQIHVVTAQQQMLAHRQSPHRQRPVALLGGDQRQIRRPAAHVHHQQRVAGRQRLPPIVPAPVQPVVNGRGRFLQQHCLIGQSRVHRRLPRQFPGRRIKRRRHGQHDVLIGQPIVRVRRIPRRDQMRQQPPRAIGRRNPRDVLRCIDRQHRVAAPAVRQPTLGRHHDAVRIVGRLRPSIRADHAANRIRRPVIAKRIDLAGPRQIHKRRQRRQRLDLVRPGPLGDRQHLDRRRHPPVAGNFAKRDDAVGRPQIDPNVISRGHDVAAD